MKNIIYWWYVPISKNGPDNNSFHKCHFDFPFIYQQISIGNSSWVNMLKSFWTNNFWIISKCFDAVHRGAFWQFPFRWIYCFGSNKSTKKETGKTHFSVLLKRDMQLLLLSFLGFSELVTQMITINHLNCHLNYSYGCKLS